MEREEIILENNVKIRGMFAARLPPSTTDQLWARDTEKQAEQTMLCTPLGIQCRSREPPGIQVAIGTSDPPPWEKDLLHDSAMRISRIPCVRVGQKNYKSFTRETRILAVGQTSTGEWKKKTYRYGQKNKSLSNIKKDHYEFLAKHNLHPSWKKWIIRCKFIRKIRWKRNKPCPQAKCKKRRPKRYTSWGETHKKIFLRWLLRNHERCIKNTVQKFSIENVWTRSECNGNIF